MGMLIKIVLFVVGLAAFALTGANVAEALQVDVAGMLGKMGAFGNMASSAVSWFDAHVLTQLGQMIGGANADPAKPSLMMQWGPAALVALVSGLVMAMSSRS